MPLRTTTDIDVELLYRKRPHDIGVARGDIRKLPRFVDELLEERFVAKRIQDETARGEARDAEQGD